jgi:hypothetical protein
VGVLHHMLPLRLGRTWPFPPGVAGPGGSASAHPGGRAGRRARRAATRRRTAPCIGTTVFSAGSSGSRQVCTDGVAPAPRAGRIYGRGQGSGPQQCSVLCRASASGAASRSVHEHTKDFARRVLNLSALLVMSSLLFRLWLALSSSHTPHTHTRQTPGSMASRQVAPKINTFRWVKPDVSSGRGVEGSGRCARKTAGVFRPAATARRRPHPSVLLCVWARAGGGHTCAAGALCQRAGLRPERAGLLALMLGERGNSPRRPEKA